jgi:hypothetical protein
VIHVRGHRKGKMLLSRSQGAFFFPHHQSHQAHFINESRSDKLRSIDRRDEAVVPNHKADNIDSNSC